MSYTDTVDPWFSQLFGFMEGDYSETQKQFTYCRETGILRSSALPERAFFAGSFETPSLEELRMRVNIEVAVGRLGRKQIAVVEDVGDVSEFHIQPENEGTLFQAASQFNTLEHTSQSGVPEKGITCYAGDHTQGPACATSCSPGTVVRNYFAFGSGEGQTRDHQVQNLADVEALLENGEEKYFKVRNGYTLASSESLARLTKLIDGDDVLQDRIRKKLRIGLQADTEVVASKFGSQLYAGPTQLVTQAYCSAVSASSGLCRNQDWKSFASLVLEAAYEATMYAAVENFLRNPSKPGSRKVFLTALGGGVFGNDMQWIKQALRKALLTFAHVGLEVHLVSYGGSTLEFAQLQQEFSVDRTTE